MISDDQKDALAQVAHQTLHVFELIATEAQSRLAQGLRSSANAFASVNSFTMSDELQTAGRVDHGEREASEHLMRESAIARVVAEDETGKSITIFSRAVAPPASGQEARFASYRSPMGRLAAHEPGDSVTIAAPNGIQTFDIVERAELQLGRAPKGWDSHNTVFLAEGFGPVTIESLRRLLDQKPPDVDTADYLAQLHTWATYRRDIARNTLSILRTGSGGGPFVMRDDEATLTSDALVAAISWYDDFQQWQRDRFWSDLAAAATTLGTADDPQFVNLGNTLFRAVAAG